MCRHWPDATRPSNGSIRPRTTTLWDTSDRADALAPAAPPAPAPRGNTVCACPWLQPLKHCPPAMPGRFTSNVPSSVVTQNTTCIKGCHRHRLNRRNPTAWTPRLRLQARKVLRSRGPIPHGGWLGTTRILFIGLRVQGESGVVAARGRPLAEIVAKRKPDAYRPERVWCGTRGAWR
jgi:hypothetical protein